MEKHQQLETANQKLEMKLEKLNTVPVEQQAEFKQLSVDIQELEQLLSHDYRRKTAALQEVISQKSDITERTRKLNELELTVTSLIEEQER
ncbi:hypothetical protein ASZ78_010392 [Callipepla squamata]|uniref:Uncharacterized protein n=1 Tax=Callipepla squamata TaxID=9009 RepID=A0A226NC18_CALSU|nr:hypothetical protein ASZ78_010392 [Callipepla squamata]